MVWDLRRIPLGEKKILKGPRGAGKRTIRTGWERGVKGPKGGGKRITRRRGLLAKKRGGPSQDGNIKNR
jgi:hypothetical protein